MVGGHYTYANMPLCKWIKPVCGCERNHYDRPGHSRPALSLLVLLAWLLLAPWPVQAAQEVVLDGSVLRVPLGLQIDILDDPSATLSHDQVSAPDVATRFVPSTKAIPGFGFSTSAIWMRWRITNATERDERWLLELAYAPMQHIDLYVQRGAPATDATSGPVTEHLRGGSALNVADRPYNHRTHVFPVMLGRGESVTLHLRLASEGSLTAPLILWRADAFARINTLEFMVLGTYVGIMLALICYNAFVFHFVREPAYAWYVAFLVSVLLFFFSMTGIGQQYVWSESPRLAMRLVPGSIGFFGIFGITFSQIFLNTRQFAPRLHKALYSVTALGVTVVILSCVGSYHLAITTAVALGLIGSTAALVTGIVAYARRQEPARYYLLAWSVLLIGSVVQATRVTGIIPTNIFTEYAQFIGSALEAILLSVALAARMKLMREEKDAAQQDALEQQREALSSKQQAMELVESWNRKLEEDVQARTRDLVSAQQRLVSKQKMAVLGVMTAGVAHEINNPNNFVHAGVKNAEAMLAQFREFLDGLLDADADPGLREAFAEHFRRISGQHELISDGSRRITAIVGGLNAVTQLHQAEQKEAEITEGLEQTLNFFQARYVDSVRIHRDMTVKATRVCWPAELNQAFLNVLLNAAQAVLDRHGQGGGGEIRVATTLPSLAQGPCLVVTVADNGVGMTPEVAEKAFDPFFTTRGVGSGSGLGLSTARDIIQTHGGEISLESTAGEGTTVTLMIPLDA
jgi:signal transduction histidine kinase